MSNVVEIIQQLKTNQRTFEARLAKIETLGVNVNRSLLRELIQDAREFHEGSVILSYILFDKQNKKEEQLEIEIQDKESLQKSSNNLNSEPEPFLDEVVKVENKEEIGDQPTQEEIIEQLENEISSAISQKSQNSFSQNEDAEDNSLAAKLARKKIDNLFNAIGINEKFLFTNELFDGNTEQFLKTIEELNNCVSLIEAKQKLTSVAEKRSWITGDEPYQKLESLISRKHC